MKFLRVFFLRRQREWPSVVTCSNCYKNCGYNETSLCRDFTWTRLDWNAQSETKHGQSATNSNTCTSMASSQRTYIYSPVVVHFYYTCCYCIGITAVMVYVGEPIKDIAGVTYNDRVTPNNKFYPKLTFAFCQDKAFWPMISVDPRHTPAWQVCRRGRLSGWKPQNMLLTLGFKLVTSYLRTRIRADALSCSNWIENSTERVLFGEWMCHYW